MSWQRPPRDGSSPATIRMEGWPDVAATRVEQPAANVRPCVLAVRFDPETAACLRAGFGRAGYDVDSVADSVADGAEALAAVEARRYAVVILDVDQRGLESLELTNLWRSRTDAAILLVASRASVEERIAGLEAGADDYMVKPFAFGELMARVRAVLRRRGGHPDRTLAFQNVSLNLETRVASRGQRAVALTPREFELLRLFLTHPRQVLTRDAIRTRIWGYDFEGDDNVIEVYVRHLRAKLGDIPPRLIWTVRGVGYVLRGETGK